MIIRSSDNSKLYPQVIKLKTSTMHIVCFLHVDLKTIFSEKNSLVRVSGFMTHLPTLFGYFCLVISPFPLNFILYLQDYNVIYFIKCKCVTI